MAFSSTLLTVPEHKTYYILKFPQHHRRLVQRTHIFCFHFRKYISARSSASFNDSKLSCQYCAKIKLCALILVSKINHFNSQSNKKPSKKLTKKATIAARQASNTFWYGRFPDSTAFLISSKRFPSVKKTISL